MKSGIFRFLTKYYTIVTVLLCITYANAQDKSDFWQRTHIGGTLGASFGNKYTDVTLAPGLLYDINDYFGVGAGLQGTYVNYKEYYKSFIYGGSVLGVFNPIEEVQLSAEVEELRANLTFNNDNGPQYVDGTPYYGAHNFWNTALFFGVGYHSDNVTFGLRYNVLYNKRDLLYSSALMPFVRLYF